MRTRAATCERGPVLYFALGGERASFHANGKVSEKIWDCAYACAGKNSLREGREIGMRLWGIMGVGREKLLQRSLAPRWASKGQPPESSAAGKDGLHG